MTHVLIKLCPDTAMSDAIRNLETCAERTLGRSRPVSSSNDLLRVASKLLADSRVAGSQDTRRLLSEARAAPRLMSGTMTNSRTVTSESSTLYSSTSRVVLCLCGLKFHC